MSLDGRHRLISADWMVVSAGTTMTADAAGALEGCVVFAHLKWKHANWSYFVLTAVVFVGYPTAFVPFLNT